ncbi:MAG: DinB family protein [Fimbriimonas sp.]|nr:DinB family protein [Fimbriimonas sp.]
MNPYLLTVIGNGPVVIRRLVNLIPDSRIDTALEPGRFTVREVVAHLADWEQLYRGRMDRALARPNTSVVVHDETRRAIEMGYARSNLYEQLNIFTTQRQKTKVLLNSLTDEEFHKCFVHPVHGPTSIEDQANTIIGHDLYHVEQLTAYLT